MTDITNQQAIQDWSRIPLETIEQWGDEGDFWKKNLLNPALFRLLGDIQGKQILEVGCGSGYLCRLMAKRGAAVTGLEPADNLHNYAVLKEQQSKQEIKYIQQDLSQMTQFANVFDVVVANMVFLDIPDYQSALKNCVMALKPGGRFIFSLAHPCFFQSVDWSQQPYLKIDQYFEEYSLMGGTSRYFHRTLSSYLNFVIKAGCQIKELVEPRLSKELADANPDIARDYYVPGFLVIHAVKV